MTIENMLKGASYKAGEITGHGVNVAESISENYDLKGKAIAGYDKVTGRSAAVDSTLLTYTLPTAMAAASTKLPGVVNECAASFTEGFTKAHVQKQSKNESQ